MFRWALIVTVFLAGAMLFSTGPAVGADIKIDGGGISIGTTPQPQPGPQPGPPAHAPAYGLRAKQHYNYYPSANCYFEPARGLYFYLGSGGWQVGASLPDSLKIKLGDSVSLELDTDKPYVYNQEHLKKYPPGQAKKMGVQGSQGNQGQGQGKGKGKNKNKD